MTIDDSVCENCLAKNHCDVLPYSNNCNEVRAMAEHDKGIYNKAIDDFIEKLNAKCDGMIKEKWNSNVAPISWAEAYADFKDDIYDIAEQLKAGVTNE